MKLQFRWLLLALPTFLLSCGGPPQPPTISSLSPSTALSGATITITGTNFVKEMTGKFGSATVPITFTNDKTATFVVPDNVSGEIPVSVSVPAGTATSSTPLFVGSDYSGAMTIAAINAAMAALPSGVALRLPAGTVPNNPAADLQVIGHSLYGAGATTIIQDNAFFFANPRKLVVKDLAFSGDYTYQVGSADFNASAARAAANISTRRVAYATPSGTVWTNEVVLPPSARVLRPQAASGSAVVFDNVSFTQATTAGGAFGLGSGNYDVEIKNSTMNLNSWSAIIVGEVILSGSTIVTQGNFQVLAQYSSAIVKNSTLRSVTGSISVSATAAAVEISGSTIEAKTVAKDITFLSQGSSVTLFDNPKIEAARNVSIQTIPFGAPNFTDSNAGTNISIKNSTIIADAIAGGADSGTINITSQSGNISLVGNPKLSADSGINAFAVGGKLNLTNNALLETLGATSAITVQNASLGPNTVSGSTPDLNVTISGNTIQTKSSVIASGYTGAFNFNNNTVTANGDNSPTINILGFENKSMTAQGNTLNVTDLNNNSPTNVSIISSKSTTFGPNAVPKATVTISNNTITQAGTSADVFGINTIYATAAFTGNSIVNKGEISLTSNTGSLSASNNTFTALKTPQALTLNASAGTVANPTTLSFTNNTSTNTSMDASGKVIYNTGASNATLTVSGNTGIYNP